MVALSNDSILAATLVHSDGALPEPSPAAASVRGRSIGRYLLLAQIGAGAMGLVFAAYDPELDRRVALKILKHASGDVAAARKRLQREAQALAKLGHPNVVAVHDVGVHDDQLFVAMEFVAGRTLGAWMGEARATQTTASAGAGATERSSRVRRWRAVLDVLVQAGRGLAAAHEAGLVHRDFKPDNVMLSDDGRVRVMDFGLARIDADERLAGRETEVLPGDLTQAGAIVGTPAYMSLEQFEAGRVDERSDQFSFCVALYEALYGERPFAGASVVELIDALRAGTLREAPRGAVVPGWLRAVVARGLARDPAARFESMHALLAALAADPVAYRRRLLLRIGLALALALSVWGVVSLSIRLGQRDAVIAEQAGEIDEKDAALAGQLVAQTRLLSEQRGLRAMALIPEPREAEALLLGVQAVGAFAPAWADAPREALQGLEHVLAHDTVLITDERVLAGHRDYLTTVEYSPDGTRLATASVDGSARLWDVATGAPRFELAGHVGPIHSTAFSPDGARLVTAGDDHSVRIWDAATGVQLARADGHQGSVNKVAYAPDGRRLATASLDGSARVWDAAIGAPLLTLRGPGNAAVLALAFTPDGARVATAGRGGDARLWDARTGALLATLKGHTGTIVDLALSPDGGRLATASLDRTARTWNAVTGEPLAVLAGHGERVARVAFAPDGSRLVTICWDSVARVFDPASGALLRELRGGHSAGLVALAFRPDGARVVTTSFEGTVTVWDPNSGAAVERLIGHPSDVWAVEYSPDGRHVVTAGVDGTARIWDLAYPRVATRVGPEQSVRAFAFTPDHRRVATVDKARRARVWDAASGEVVATLGGEVLGLAISPDGRRVAAVDARAVQIRDAASGEATATGDVPTGAGAIEYSPDGARLHVRGARSIWVVDAATARRVATIDLADDFHDQVIAPDGAQLATAAEEPVVRVWDARTGEPVATLAHAAAGIRNLDWSPDGSRIATALTDEVHLWDARTHAHLARCEGHRGLPRGLQFSPDGARLVATSDSAGAWIWATTDCRLLGRYEPDDHNPKTGAARFSPDGRRIAILSDRLVRLWSADDHQILADLDGHDAKVLSAVFSPDGAHLTTESANTLKVWDVRTGLLVSRERIGVVGPDGAVTWPTDPRALTTIGCDRLRTYGRVHAQVRDICDPLVEARRQPAEP